MCITLHYSNADQIALPTSPLSYPPSVVTPSPLFLYITTMDKRKDPPTNEGVLIKRQKPEETAQTSNAVTIQTKGASGALIQTVRRHIQSEKALLSQGRYF